MNEGLAQVAGIDISKHHLDVDLPPGGATATGEQQVWLCGDQFAAEPVESGDLRAAIWHRRLLSVRLRIAPLERGLEPFGRDESGRTLRVRGRPNFR